MVQLLVASHQTDSLSQSDNLFWLDYCCLLVARGAGDAMPKACSLLANGVLKATRLHCWLEDAVLFLVDQIHFTCAESCGWIPFWSRSLSDRSLCGPKSKAFWGFGSRLVSVKAKCSDNLQQVLSMSSCTGWASAGRRLWWSSWTTYVKMVHQKAVLTHKAHRAWHPSTTHLSTVSKAVIALFLVTGSKVCPLRSLPWPTWPPVLWRFRNLLFIRFPSWSRKRFNPSGLYE